MNNLHGFCHRLRVYNSWGALLLFSLNLAHKSLICLLMVVTSTIHPRVLSDLVDCWSLAAFLIKNCQNQVFELQAETSCVGLVEVQFTLASD